ncbi:MAG: peptide chain release factor N(5)-glutamine methyltransferase [Candidatus Kerfeldbacteria bacterium]|nr:peptide chain release factor N(5)-glutamine methyltransferase [Candidatus Kerfeldbacteria bacterium]
MNRNLASQPSAAEVDLLRALAVDRPYAWILAHPEAPLTPTQRRRLGQWLRQRRRGQPLAYITGRKEFFRRPFEVTPSVLVPRPETEHLIEAALALPLHRTAAVADIGTGSGCIAVTLALERPSWQVLAIDRSAAALSVAKRNLKRYQLRQRVRLLHGDLLAPLRRRLIPDAIVANLPYATPLEHRTVSREPKLAIVGGRDGLSVFRRFWKQLSATGWRVPVVLEVDPRRLDAVATLAGQCYGSHDLRVTEDLAGRDRVLTVIPTSIR